jgi:LCP family protein required for cell wall assembly
MPQNSMSMPRPPRPPAPPNGNGRPQPGQASVQLPIPPRTPGVASVQLPIPPDADKTQYQAAVAPPNQHTGSNPVPPALQRPQPSVERPAPPEHPALPERKPLPPRPTDISMTTEMEAISESVQEIRRVDATLARFSAVHDELAEEERLKKEKRERLMPWLKAESEGGEEPDALAEDQASGTFDDELAELETVLVEPAELPGRERRPPRKLALAGRISTAALAAILLVVTGYAWKITNVDGQVRQVDALDPNSAAIADAPAQLGDENFLMVGSDTREGASAEDGVGNADAVPGARSDTIMVAHIPKDRKRVVMASFPRDLEIQRPECERYDAKTGKYSTEKTKPAANQKINTAFQVGGPKCVTKVIQTLTGLRINHFVGIDFNGFKGMVDAVQGVEVCVERPMYDTELKTWIVQTPGQNVKLEGDAALNFVRARHVQDSPARNAKSDPTSDYGRIKRQQRFLSSLLRKAMSGQVLLDPGKLTDFINAFSKATFGDGIGTQDLITLGRSLQNIGAGKVTFLTVPTTLEANKRGNEELREKDNKNLFTAIINEQPLPGEQADSGAPQGQAQNKPPDSLKAPDPIDPKNVKIQVLNAGAGDGKAGPASNALRNQGFQIMRTDNSPEKLPKTVVRYGSAEAAAQLVASAVPGAAVQKDDSLGGAVILMLGQDYKGQIVQAKQGTTAPNAGGSAPASSPPPAAPLPGDLATVNAGDQKCA